MESLAEHLGRWAEWISAQSGPLSVPLKRLTMSNCLWRVARVKLVTWCVVKCLSGTIPTSESSGKLLLTRRASFPPLKPSVSPKGRMEEGGQSEGTARMSRRLAMLTPAETRAVHIHSGATWSPQSSCDCVLPVVSVVLI